MTITEKMLSSQDYIEFSPEEKNSFEYKLSYLVKEEIRKHLWIENEKGRNLTWESGCEEWMDNYYSEFIKFARCNLNKKKIKVTSKLNYKFTGYQRREAVIRGHFV